MWRLFLLLMTLWSLEVTKGQIVPPGVVQQQLTPLTSEQFEWSVNVVGQIPSWHQIFNSSKSRVISLSCYDSLQEYSEGLSTKQLWAFTMLDASTKVPESILSGAWLHLGNFDQCLGVATPTFLTQHCGISVTLSKEDFSISLTVASCLPASCSARDVQSAVTSILTPIYASMNATVDVSVSDRNCYVAERPPLNFASWFMIGVFCLLGLLVAYGTCNDLLRNDTKKKSVMREVMQSFSLSHNIPALLSTQHAPGSVTCIHGIRVLSLWWVMLAHRFGQNLGLPLINPGEFLKHLSEPLTSIILNGYMAVDTFFFLSGFLVSHVYFIDRSKGRPFNVFKFYIYRYIRLTTCLALLIGYYVTLMRHTGYGPRWHAATDSQMTYCDDYWWLNIIYLSNYVRFDHHNWQELGAPLRECVDQAWYLSVDMQLAWFAPLVLIPMYKWPRIGTRVVLPLVTLASCLAPFISTYINEFPMVSLVTGVTSVESRKYIVEMYWPMHMRATPYLIGIACAYLMHGVHRYNITINKWMVCVYWTASTVICLTIVCITAIQYADYYVYEKFTASLYAGFHRVGWSLSLSWIVFACSRGYGGLVNKILSWRAFLPLSRLSYCMFITHFITLYYDCGQVRTYYNYTNFNNTMDFLSDVWVACLMLALPMYLFCEAPTLNLLRIFFRKGSDVKKIPEVKDAK